MELGRGTTKTCQKVGQTHDRQKERLKLIDDSTFCELNFFNPAVLAYQHFVTIAFSKVRITTWCNTGELACICSCARPWVSQSKFLTGQKFIRPCDGWSETLVSPCSPIVRHTVNNISPNCRELLMRNKYIFSKMDWKLAGSVKLSCQIAQCLRQWRTF